MTAPRPARRWRPTRRGFLIGLGTGAAALAVGTPIAWDLARPEILRGAADAGYGAGEVPTTPGLWFELSAAGLVLYLPKVEMGQGIHTALAQLAVEELRVAPDALTVRQADSGRGFGDVAYTFGSSSVTSLFTPLRQVAATVREMVRAEAAAQLGTPAVDVAGGVFTGGGRGLTYAEVLAAKAGPWAEPAEAPALTAPADFTVIGQPFPRVDMRDKVLGRAVYGYDARVDGMAYGAVARPPRFGATLAAGGPGTAADRPGVLAVVVDVEAGFAGVVADTRTRARAAVEGLDLTWEGGTATEAADVDTLVTAGGGAVLRRDGDLDAALAAGRVVEAEYRTPLAAHAALEPLAALARVDDRLVEVWLATQSVAEEIGAIRDALGGDREVVVHPTLLGGSFGRKVSHSAAVEAARLAVAAGVPVHVGWTREEDLRHSYHRPPTHTRLRGSVDGTGRIRGIEQFTASGDVLWGIGGLPETVRDILGFDPGVLLGQFLPYDVEAYRVVNRREALPVPTGPWRGLGLFPNVFALESFVDELAAAAGADPLAFRLAHLGDDEPARRLRGVLTRVGEMAGWGAPGRALGIACAIDIGTAVAQVAEVSVSGTVITVERVWAAVDAGLVVNPAGAALQAQGSIVMGLSSTLVETVGLAAGRVSTDNLDTYPLLRLRDTPPVEVAFVGGGDEPRGMGEPVIGPVAAAVANAVAAATGTRLRSLPLRL